MTRVKYEGDAKSALRLTSLSKLCQRLLWFILLWNAHSSHFRHIGITVRLIRLDSGLDLNVWRDPQNWNMAGGDFDAI